MWIKSFRADTGASKCLQTRVLLFTDYNAQGPGLARHFSGPSRWHEALPVLLPTLEPAVFIQFDWAELNSPETQLGMWDSLAHREIYVD